MPGPGPGGPPGQFPFLGPSLTVADTPVQVGASLGVSWRIHALVGLAAALSWRLHTTVQLAQGLLWRIHALVGVSETDAYRIRGAVGKALAGSWRIHALVGAARTASWRINALVGKAQVASWRIGATVAQPVVLRWAIAGRTQVGAALAMGWQVLGNVLVFTGGWVGVYTPPKAQPRPPAVAPVQVGAGLDLSWGIAGAVGVECSLSWGIFGPSNEGARPTQPARATRAARAQPVGWKLRERQAATVTVAWQFWRTNREVLLAEVDEDLLLAGAGAVDTPR